MQTTRRRHPIQVRSKDMDTFGAWQTLLLRTRRLPSAVPCSWPPAPHMLPLFRLLSFPAGNTWAESVNTSLHSLPSDEPASTRSRRHSSIDMDDHEETTSRTLSLEDYSTEPGPLFGSVDV